MIIDDLGNPVYSTEDIIEMIYQDRLDLLDKIDSDPENEEVLEYNRISNILEIDPIKLYQKAQIDRDQFDKTNSNKWFMPEKYKSIDIEGFLVNQCPKEHYQRLIDELKEYRERNMLDLLRWLKYFVDTCRSNDIVWGVGRGSSVASYVLFLIGVHKIDSIKYKLDWREFLR